MEALPKRGEKKDSFHSRKVSPKRKKNKTNKKHFFPFSTNKKHGPPLFLFLPPSPSLPTAGSEARGLEVHEGARGPREDLRHEEGLRQEPLHLARRAARRSVADGWGIGGWVFFPGEDEGIGPFEGKPRQRKK